MKQVVQKKKDMYKKALGERSDRAWEDYKVAKEEAKHVVKRGEGSRLGKMWKAAAKELSRKSQGILVDRERKGEYK